MKEELLELIERWPLVKQLELPKEAVIVVVGAYKGATMELLSELFPTASIYGFEPQMWAAKEARIRLVDKLNCRIFDYGLGVEEFEADMGEFGTDAASLVNTGSGSREHGKGQFYEMDLVLHMLHLDRIDLMIMNIEGYEFQLLSYMWSKAIFGDIDRIAIQFHTDFDKEHIYGSILEKLHYMYGDIVLDELPSWGYWVHLASR